MPGYNHYLDCTCGWCLKKSASSPYLESNGPRWNGLRASESSYTDPNAICPVCGAPVFFYKSPFGGRVFFDELGPPWPKHPCTDNPYIPVPRYTKVETKSTNPPAWKKAGWEPIIIAEVKKVRDWAYLKLRHMAMDRSTHIIRITPWREHLVEGAPAHIRALDAFGLGRISMLLSTPNGFEPIKAILAHRVFLASDKQTLQFARKDDMQSAILIANATYMAWAKKKEGTIELEFPKFVDFNISWRWLQKAATLGSAEAAETLRTDPIFKKLG